jgi:hypothetical protein
VNALQAGIENVAGAEQVLRVQATLGFAGVALLIFWPFGRYGMRAWRWSGWALRSVAWVALLYGYVVWFLAPVNFGEAMAVTAHLLVAAASFGLTPELALLPRPLPPEVPGLLWLGPPLIAAFGLWYLKRPRVSTRAEATSGISAV